MPRKTEPTDDDLIEIALAVQLYLVDRYNLGAADTATVFACALGESIAYGLKPGKSIEDCVAMAATHVTRFAEFRQQNPPAMGLGEILVEYRRTGGKARVN